MPSAAWPLSYNGPLCAATRASLWPPCFRGYTFPAVPLRGGVFSTGKKRPCAMCRRVNALCLYPLKNRGLYRGATRGGGIFCGLFFRSPVLHSKNGIKKGIRRRGVLQGHKISEVPAPLFLPGRFLPKNPRVKFRAGNGQKFRDQFSRIGPRCHFLNRPLVPIGLAELLSI